MTPIVPQRPGRGAPRLAPLVGATAMAMVLTACVQTGAQAPIQYAAPGQAYAAGWPSPTPSTAGTPAISSTYLGQPTTYAGGAGAGVAPFYDQRLTAAPVYGPATSYLSEVSYGYGVAAPVQTPAQTAVLSSPYVSAPSWSAPGYSTTASYVQPSIPTTTVYAQPSLSAPAPAPIYDPAPAPTYNYAYGSTPALGGVTLYDGRLPAAPVYAPGSNYVASASMSPIYEPQDYVSTAQAYAPGQIYYPPAQSYAAPAPSYAASAPPIHNPWPPQDQGYGQSYGTVQSVQTINDAPWTSAYAPAPQTTYQSYAAPSYQQPVYAPQAQNLAGLGLAPNSYASTYARGDVFFRVTDADLRLGGQQQFAGYAAPSYAAPSYPAQQPLSYGDAPYGVANVPANPAPLGIGGLQSTWGIGPVTAAPNYAPPTSYVQPYAPPSNLSEPYPRPYPVSGIGIYPASPTPTGVASARVLDYGVQQAAPIFGPGTPIYADPRAQRYVREIVRLPQPQPGLWTDAASLRAGALVPASSGPAYNVSAGDTLYRIARTHGVSVEALAAANGLSLDAAIHPGQPLYIPRGGIGPMVPVYETIAQGPSAAPSAARIETGSTAPTGLGPRAEAPDFVWPLRGPLTARRDAYGVTSVEVKGAPGTAVQAAADGRAIHVENGPQGVMVVLDHGGGWTSIHVGLAEVGLQVGRLVKAGERLGVLAARPEAGLVFELRRNNLPVDPTERMRG